MPRTVSASRLRRPMQILCSIPIIDGKRRVVGWTTDTPTLGGASLRHEVAERLVGGPLAPAYVEINDQSAAVRAGAPQGWNGPWRCLGLCAEKALPRGAGEVTTVVIESYAEPDGS